MLRQNPFVSLHVSTLKMCYIPGTALADGYSAAKVSRAPVIVELFHSREVGLFICLFVCLILLCLDNPDSSLTGSLLV